MSAGDLIIAADFGTSSAKIGVVDAEFRILARTLRPYPTDISQPSRAEQNPEDWWTALRDGIAMLKRDVPDLAERAGTLSLAAQMCGVVCADADGTPVHPCLIWQDKRAAAISGAMIGGFPQIHGYQLGKLLRWIRLANGAPSRNGMDPPAKIRWLQTHAPDVVARTHCFLDVKDWLLHRATGAFATTADSANLTWLMDTRQGREGWSADLAGRLGISLDQLPRIVDGAEVLDTLSPRAAADLGLSPKVRVVGGAGDVTATAVGSGAVADGALHICMSTSSWVSGFFDRRILSVPNSFATIASAVGHRPLLIATQESAGSTLDWAARLGAPDSDPPDLTAAYAEIGAPVEDDPFLIPWFVGERVPVDNEALRGVLHGLTLKHDHAALRRAAVEGVVLNLRWAYEKVIAKTGVTCDSPLPLVGGGATNPRLAQMLANALGQEVVTGDGRFAGVLGAAAIAAPAQGWCRDVWEAAGALDRLVQARYAPQPRQRAALETRYARLSGIRRRLLRTYPSST